MSKTVRVAHDVETAEQISNASLKPFDEDQADVAMQQEEGPYREQSLKPWYFYWERAQITQIFTKKYTVFGPVFLFYYALQFVMCVGVCNFYSDISRYHICQRADGSLIRGDEASAIYDTALYLAGIFHVCEWIRATILVVITLIGMEYPYAVYKYSGYISVPFGLIVLIFVHIAYGSPDGWACAEYQKTRHQWLMCEIIYFWTLFWWFSFPCCFLRCYRR